MVHTNDTDTVQDGGGTPVPMSDQMEQEEREDRVRDVRTFRTWMKRYPHMADDLGLLAVAEGLGAAALAAGVTPAQLIEEIEQGYRQASEKFARRTRQ